MRLGNINKIFNIQIKKNNRRNCHWPVGMPYTPDVATIYPNIDTVLSNYVISDAIYDAGVINNKLSTKKNAVSSTGSNRRCILPNNLTQYLRALVVLL